MDIYRLILSKLIIRKCIYLYSYHFSKKKYEKHLQYTKCFLPLQSYLSNRLQNTQRRGRVVECVGLENRSPFTRTGGSNPSVSATYLN